MPNSAPLGLAGAEGSLLGQRRISHGGRHPSPAIHLKDAAVGHGAEGRKIPGAVGIVILRAIEAALHVGETESADQPLGDAVALDDSQRFILGRDFAAVGEFKAAEAHVRVLALQMQIGLLDENAGGVLIVVIRRVVTAAQAELPMGAGWTA